MRIYKLKFMLLIAFTWVATMSLEAQSKLYPRLFDLQEVSLDNGVFKHAMLINDSVLLEYDVNRLLTPYFRQAGLTDWEARHPNFSNWGSGNFRLDGHVGGHYLSALALAYAASQDDAMKAKMKERMDYMVDMMDSCQKVFDNNTNGLYGYIGGLPDNNVWTGIYNNNLTAYNNNRGNVPLYTMHKVYAGFRDAWMYGGNEKAKTCFLKLCDWGVNLISKLTDATVQSILDTEHGGINEVYVDAYQMTGDEKYLTAAIRYSHETMVTNMQTVNSTFLDNKHANTQVPKYIGFARLAQEDDKSTAATVATYRKAANNFWTEVVNNRTVAIGGNSISEHFLPASRGADYTNHPDGPESCNTNNMMKLTEDLFADRQDAKYADFYEQAMLNHILSTQHPHTGGYVYFTSLRPQHYRMYSQVNQGMWCCVGTGMENHSKYGEFIYAHSLANDSLYVNLFVASTLKNENFALQQETTFPYEEQTKLTINKAGDYVIAIRHPEWCKGEYKILVNGTEATINSTPGTYAYLNRSWAEGDVITLQMPMQLELLPCPNNETYVAFRYGPVLLSAITSTEGLAGQFAGEGRMDHAPSQGAQLSLTSAPMLIGNRADVLSYVEPVDKNKLHFKIKPGLYNSERFNDLILQPFFTVHEARYMIYWNQLTQEEWDKIKEDIIAEEQAAQSIQNRTLDFVATGEQQSDAGHVLVGEFGKGTYAGEFYVDAQAGKWFSYQLATQGVSKDISLMCRYHTADVGRKSTIYINDKEFQKVTIETQPTAGFFNVEYYVPEEYLLNADGEVMDSITVKFAADCGTMAPGLYYLRLLKEYRTIQPYSFACHHWKSADDNRVKSVERDHENNTIKVYGYAGNNNIALQMNPIYDDSTYIKKEQKYLLIKGTSLKTGTGMSYLWWLNGANHGSQVAATYEGQNDNGETFIIWDTTIGGLNDYMQTDSISIGTQGNAMSTVFGVTSNASDYSAVISDIGFYSLSEMLSKYPEVNSFCKVNVFTENDETFSCKKSFQNVLVEKSFKADQWTALCFPFNVSKSVCDGLFSEIKKYCGMTKTDDGTLTIYFDDFNRILKDSLLLVKSINDMESLEFASIKSYASTAPSAKGTDAIKVQGTYTLYQTEGDTYFYNGEKFEVNSASDIIKGLCFYIQLSDEEMTSVKEVVISFDPMPDGIKPIYGKVKDASVYNINGVKIGETKATKSILEGLPKGIYIIGGKKVTN